MKLLIATADASLGDALTEAMHAAGHEVVRSDDSTGSPLRNAWFDALVLDEHLEGVVVLAATVLVEQTRSTIFYLSDDPQGPGVEDVRGLGAHVLPRGPGAGGEVLAIMQRLREEAPDLTSFPGVSEEELQMLTKLLQQVPNSPKVQWLLGFAQYRAGNWDQAHPLLEGVVEADAEDLQARYYLGSCKYRLGHDEAAIELWKSVVAADVGGDLGRKAWRHLKRVEAKRSST